MWMRVWVSRWVCVLSVCVSLERGWQRIIAAGIDRRYSISFYGLAFSELRLILHIFVSFLVWFSSVGFSEAKLGWNYGSNRIHGVVLRLRLPIDTNRYLSISLPFQLCFDKRSSHNKNNLYFRKGGGALLLLLSLTAFSAFSLALFAFFALCLLRFLRLIR